MGFHLFLLHLKTQHCHCPSNMSGCSPWTDSPPTGSNCPFGGYYLSQAEFELEFEFQAAHLSLGGLRQQIRAFKGLLRPLILPSGLLWVWSLSLYFLLSRLPPHPVSSSSKPTGPETPDSTVNPNLLSFLDGSAHWEKVEDIPLHKNLPSQCPLVSLVLAKVKRKTCLNPELSTFKAGRIGAWGRG